MRIRFKVNGTYQHTSSNFSIHIIYREFKVFFSNFLQCFINIFKYNDKINQKCGAQGTAEHLLNFYICWNAYTLIKAKVGWDREFNHQLPESPNASSWSSWLCHHQRKPLRWQCSYQWSRKVSILCTTYFPHVEHFVSILHVAEYFLSILRYLFS